MENRKRHGLPRPQEMRPHFQIFDGAVYFTFCFIFHKMITLPKVEFDTLRGMKNKKPNKTKMQLGFVKKTMLLGPLIAWR